MFLYVLIKSFCRLTRLINRNMIIDNQLVKSIIKNIKKISTEQYDIVIAVSGPYETAIACSNWFSIHSYYGKCVLYQIDPFLGKSRSDQDNPQLSKIERVVLAKYDTVITHWLIYRDFAQKGFDISKIKTIEFPVMKVFTEVFDKEFLRVAFGMDV